MAPKILLPIPCVIHVFNFLQSRMRPSFRPNLTPKPPPPSQPQFPPHRSQVRALVPMLFICSARSPLQPKVCADNHSRAGARLELASHLAAFHSITECWRAHSILPTINHNISRRISVWHKTAPNTYITRHQSSPHHNTGWPVEHEPRFPWNSWKSLLAFRSDRNTVFIIYTRHEGWLCCLLHSSFQNCLKSLHCRWNIKPVF